MKILAWQLTKVKNKTEVIEEARNKDRKIHFASLMDLCHLKNSELEPQYQKYKGRVVLQGDIVKDDSGSYAVFTEQGSSTSQMTAAKVMDIISRLPGCSGQAADAVSAETQVKMEDASTLFKNSKVRMSRHLDTSTEAQKAKIMVQYGRPSCSSRKESGKVALSTEREDYSYQCMWTISNWQARHKTWNRLGKFSWKTSTRENQHHFLTVYVGVALKESVKLVMILWHTREICSNPGFLLEPRKNYLSELQGNLMQKQSLLGPWTWKVTHRTVWKNIANLRIKRLNNYTKSQLHAWMTINLRKKKMSQ